MISNYKKIINKLVLILNWWLISLKMIRNIKRVIEPTKEYYRFLWGYLEGAKTVIANDLPFAYLLN